MTGFHHVRILIPMLGRAHLVAPLVANIQAYGGAPILFVCSPNDRDALVECNRSGADVLVVDWEPGRADYAAKINLGYRETIEPWVFTGASDLVFTPDWDVHALVVGERTGAGVIGTQDTSNPLVKRGVQSTHSLVRREYVQEFGGTFDNTGAIYSETYDHQYIDIELVETAKLRGRWAFSKRSVVEHKHPHWATAPMDSTYEKATRQTTQDRRLFQARMKRCERALARNSRRSAV